MRLTFIIPIVIAVTGLTAWLAVHVAASIDFRHIALGYLWAFLGIAVLIWLFVGMGESVIEDAVKTIMFTIISLLLLGRGIPALIPCTAIFGALVASGTNQLLKLKRRR